MIVNITKGEKGRGKKIKVKKKEMISHEIFEVLKRCGVWGGGAGRG